ncbi:MAG: amidase [Candidatus Marinimicrobia bacterium]|nr:amidase [Candidatus Neomarinimicrobiota bacterium]
MKKQNIFRLLYAIVLIAFISVIIISRESARKDYNKFKFLEYDIAQLQEGYQAGTFTIQEVVQSYLDRINAIDNQGPAIHAIITINPDAIAIAKILDKEMKAGNICGPLHGIPIILKDNIDTHDKMSTTAGSRALMNSYPLQDALVTKQLQDAGAIIIGKANLSEWANFRGELSTSGWSGVGGQTKNPYVLNRNPCGSSSGSAVAVSANLTMLAIGTETNGSIVCPSHANGIVGIKPTVGLVSRSGIIPISWTQDTAGPMARTVRDAAMCLSVLTRKDPNDDKTLLTDRKTYPDYTQFLNKNGLQGKRIAYYTAFKEINYKVDALMDEAIDDMKSMGAEIIEIDNILADSVGHYSFEIMLYEYKDGLNKYFKSLGPNTPIKNLEELIAFNNNDPLEMAQEKAGLDSKEYQKALAKMIQGSREDGIDRVMDENDLDAIIAPTGTPAWKTDWINGDSFQFGSSSPAAQSGYPNITVPMGFVDELPVGISIFGRAWSENVLIEIAYAYEQGIPHRRVPEFLEGEK